VSLAGRVTRPRRISHGVYRVAHVVTGLTVAVVRNDQLAGPDKWIAYAEWDTDIVIDPVRTMRDAVSAAGDILRDGAREVTP
jgi:hypothetical protein